jgi:hypothetical protein
VPQTSLDFFAARLLGAAGFAEPNGAPGRLVPTALGRDVGGALDLN